MVAGDKNYSQEVSHLKKEIEKKEITELCKANLELNREIEALRDELIWLEVRYGVTQVSIPKVEVGRNSVTPVMGGEAKPKKEKKEKTSQPKVTPLPVDAAQLDLRVGRVLSVVKHENADSLYVECVDIGDGRVLTVVSGLVRHITAEELSGRLAVFLCNLKPASMRGVLSEGMIMCASTPEKVEILSPPSGSIPGDRVVSLNNPENITPPAICKKKAWDEIQPCLLVNESGVATYKDREFVVAGKGSVTAPSMRKCPIK